jgi:hypothetical protein
MVDKIAIMTHKKCTKCGEVKLLECFSVDKRHRDGHTSWCKKCACINSSRWEKKNKDKVCANSKKWKERNPEHGREYAKKYLAQHPDYVKIWDKQHPERARERVNRWQLNNPERLRELRRNSDAKKRSTPGGKLSDSMSSHIWYSLHRGEKRYRKWESLVGYDVVRLLGHLEKRFKPGMTWNNYGEWHVDHIIPISAFNFEKPEDIDFKRCWTLENLQPLWAKENLVKHKKIDKPFQPSLRLSV